MHKLPQPVKLWYLSSFFRYERAQAGRYRQFWQIGAEAIGSDDPAVDAESILLLHALLDRARRPRRAPAALVASARRRPARALPRASCRTTCARTRTSSAARSAARIDLNPLRAFDSRPPRHAGGDGAPRRAARPASTATTPSTSPRSARCSTPPAWPTRSTRRSCAASTTTRGRSSSSPPTRSARRARVGGGGRYDGLIEQLGGPPTPGIGLGRGRRADAPGRRGPPAARAGRRPLRRVRRAADARRRVFAARRRGAGAPG